MSRGKFLIKIVKPKLIFQHRASFDDFMKKAKDGEYQMLIEPHKDIRDLATNKKYWLYLREISNETGNDIDDLHVVFKDKFLMPRFELIMGEYTQLPPTTTTLTEQEFWEYITKINALTNVDYPWIR